MKKPEEEIEKVIKPFREIETESRDREKLLDDFILALNTSNLDSEQADRYVRRRAVFSFLFLALGIFLILLAGLIILYPLPKFLEVKTLFYFNPNDGITVSDIVGVFILFLGIIIIAQGTSFRKVN